MKLSDLHRKLLNRWKKFRLQPIRIFCFHHVSDTFDTESMNCGDWMNIEDFKSKVRSSQQDGVEFVSLTVAYQHIRQDYVRCRNYAVITFDDGYASLKEILPWLEEQKIPCALFINGKYLDGKSYRKNPKEKYLTTDELFALTSPLIEIGSHGWEHTNAKEMSADEFQQSIKQNIELLQLHPRYVPFHAYTWGEHTQTTDLYLHSKGITPVYIDGVKNYQDSDVVHREIMN